MAGAGALSPESIDGVVLYPDLLIQVDPNPALLSVEYLALAWRSRRVRYQVEARLRTSAGIHKINLANLSTVEVPTPPIGEQRQVAARLREQLAEIDRAKASLEAQCAAVEALPATLLREAFADMAVIRP
jgi:type I restriction enzyme S subunit